MQKAAALFLILFWGISVLLFAQDDSDPETEPDWGDIYSNELYSRGDQTLSIGVGVGFPIVFINNGKEIPHGIKIPNTEIPMGGTGILNYTYYLNSYFFTGGELGLLFMPTTGGNTVFMTFFGARAGTQFILGKFEFPIFISLGGTIQTYLDFGYFGLYMKAGIGAYFRITHEWSFGITSNFSWFPQWTNEPAKNVDALFVDLAIVGRYHF
ncbi:hypothetical protein R84B8_01999 [Treponema sp. R8-4-B8]